MNILIIGGGGREHALAWKSIQSPLVSQVFVAPGNAGTHQEHGISNVSIDAEHIEALLEFAQSKSIELTIVGPEAPLVTGIVDQFQSAGLRIFGPSAAAAQLEGSKTFTKDFLQRHKIPTAQYRVLPKSNQRSNMLKQKAFPLSLKPTVWPLVKVSSWRILKTKRLIQSKICSRVTRSVKLAIVLL